MARAGCCQSPSPLQVTPKPAGINLTHLFPAKPHPRASLRWVFLVVLLCKPTGILPPFQGCQFLLLPKILIHYHLSIFAFAFPTLPLHSSPSKPQTPSDKPRDCLYFPRTLPASGIPSACPREQSLGIEWWSTLHHHRMSREITRCKAMAPKARQF